MTVLPGVRLVFCSEKWASSSPAPDTPPELLPRQPGKGRSLLCFLFVVLEAV
jgi:hypothetical protein